MKTTDRQAIPVSTRWDVHLRYPQSMFSYETYYVDSFDAIDDAHQPLCRLLNAARDENNREGTIVKAEIEGVGQAAFYPDCPPIYYLYVNPKEPP